MATYNFNVLVKDQSETLVASATVIAYKSDGTVSGTGTTNASGVLAADLVLNTVDNTHLITVTKTGYTTFSQYYIVYQNDTSFYIRLPSYSTNYCTVSEVAQFLGLLSTTFSPTSTPTDSYLSEIILRNESEVDSFLMSSWKSNTVSLEYHSLDREALNDDLFHPVFPKYRPLRTKDSTFVIENFDGSTYVDFVASKTEGRADDYYFDYNKSILYIKPISYGDQYLRLTYKWGYSSVPNDVKKLCILKTALNLVDMDDFAGNIREGDIKLADKRQSYIEQIKMLENHLKRIRFS